MRNLFFPLWLAPIILLSGCAHIDFNGSSNGLTYYVPKPYLFVSTTKDCVSTATVVSLPGKAKSMELHSGFGTADLSVNFSNGMITSVGQKTDTKIPETMTSLANLATAAVGIKALEAKPKKEGCAATARLYPIKDGVPDTTSPINFPTN